MKNLYVVLINSRKHRTRLDTFHLEKLGKSNHQILPANNYEDAEETIKNLETNKISYIVVTDSKILYGNQKICTSGLLKNVNNPRRIVLHTLEEYHELSNALKEMIDNGANHVVKDYGHLECSNRYYREVLGPAFITLGKGRED